MLYYKLKNAYELNCQVRLINGIMQIGYGIKSPRQLVYDTCRDQLIKNLLFGK